MLGALADPVVASDAGNRLVYVNAAASALLGWPPDELIGRPLSDIIPPTYRTRHQEAFERFIRTGVPHIIGHPIRVPALTRSGETVDIELTLAALRGENILIVASLRDLSQRADAVTIASPAEAVRRVEELEETIRARDEFLSSVSHDLKNPLAAIKARAQMLRRRVEKMEDPSAGRIAEGLDAINVSVTRMTRLINDLADLVNMRAGRPLMLNREDVDLVALARDVAAEQQTALGRSIEVEPRVPSLQARVDPSRIERVVGNLLSNAAKYSPGGGAIRLVIDRDETATPHRAIMAVTDEGIGIPPQDLPRIFDRFYRASNSTEVGGSGIGLATARQIVQQHGGTIAASSEVGRGSTFTVRLPI
jgi:PAS domain S-box-containing protein